MPASTLRLVAFLPLILLGCNSAPGGSGAELASAKDVDTSADTGAAAGASGTALHALSDEFDDSSSLADWTIYHEETSSTNYADELEIDGQSYGALRIVPNGGAWYMNGQSVYLHKLVAGDFVIMMRVRAGNTSDPTIAPTQQYNSAGMVVRDPSSTSGDEDWLMYDVGYQDSGTGSEGKTTVDSVSTLYITPGSNRGLLAICRIGDTFHMLRNLDGDSGWSETETFYRPDMPDTLQAGPIVNGWATPPDLVAEFDWVRFAPVSSYADCTDIPPAN